ncbi:MAG: DUF998 domain-containing protein [Nitrospirota bacterium]
MINFNSSSISSGFASQRIVWLGAIVWIFAVQFFVVQVVVQSAWETPFSLMHNFISDLGNTRCGPYPIDSEMYVCSPWYRWMNASFILLGMIILVGALLVHKAFTGGIARTAGLTFLVLAGFGNIAVGLFPEDVNNTYHTIGAAAHFIFGNIGMSALGIAFGQNRQRPGVLIYSIVSGMVGLLATGLFVSGHYLGMGIGGMERIAAYPLPLWLIVMGIFFVTNVPAEPNQSYMDSP